MEKKQLYAVQALLGGNKLMAIEIFVNFKTASDYAKKAVAARWKGVRVKRLTTTEDIDAAEFQIEKIADWASDGDVRE